MADPTWTLVHGVAGVASASGVIGYAHAWLKRDGWVYDAVRDASYTVADYATRFYAREVGTFSLVEAARACIAFGYVYRPWVKYDEHVIDIGGER